MNDRLIQQDPVWTSGVRDAVLRHFDTHARSLPWRQTTDPYSIWISEVMLQQTRVAAVVPYYERWVTRFPDVTTLADAPLDDVLKTWEGLGYYSRARNLHRAARLLRERHNAAVPGDYDALRALPGIGDYTAGAVASIAFGVRRPAIDGNVRRVVARLIDHPDPPHRLVRNTVDALLPADRPGAFNQALMELGATICSPRAPRCATCPITSFCRAHAAGTQHERPAPRRRPAPPLFLLATAVITRADGRVLLTRRPATGLLANMWCFPAAPVNDPDASRDAAVDVARALLGDSFTMSAAWLTSIDHTFTHRRERYLCWLVVAPELGDVVTVDAAWADGDAAGYALPRAQRRILRHVHASV